MPFLTPTSNEYIIDISKYSNRTKGSYVLINYTKGTGTETGIEIYQLFKFNGDASYRYRDYLGINSVRTKYVEKITDTSKNIFIEIPVMYFCDRLKIEIQFTGYTSGNYGSVEIASVEDISEAV